MLDAGVRLERINVDGGLTRSDLLMQMQADMLGIGSSRRAMPEGAGVGGRGTWQESGAGCGMPTACRSRRATEAVLFEPRPTVRDGYAARFEKWKQACDAVIAMGDAGVFEVEFSSRSRSEDDRARPRSNMMTTPRPPRRETSGTTGLGSVAADHQLNRACFATERPYDVAIIGAGVIGCAAGLRTVAVPRASC